MRRVFGRLVKYWWNKKITKCKVTGSSFVPHPSSCETVVQGMDDEDDEELQRALADDIISASEDEVGYTHTPAVIILSNNKTVAYLSIWNLKHAGGTCKRRSLYWESVWADFSKHMNSGLVGSFRVQCSALRWPFLQGTCLLLSWKCMHTEIHLGAWKKMSPGNKARILHFLGHWYLRGYASKMDECRALLCVLSHTGRQRWWEETLQAAGGHQLAWGEEEVRDVRTLCSYSTFLDELGF